MIPFEEIDRRLDAISKDRKWLAEVTQRSPDSIRAALAPKAHPKQRSSLLQKALSDAIISEEDAQAAMQEPPQPGFHNIFLDDAQLDRADRASRQIHAASLVDFCRDAIVFRADELLAGRADPVSRNILAPKLLPDPPSYLIELPFYGTVAAGMPGGPLDTADGTHPVPTGYDPATHYVLRVNGQSMEPDYPDGSHVICRVLKPGEFAKKGQDVIACDASGAYFKRLVYPKDGPKGASPRKATPRLISINPEYPEVSPLAACPIVAVVVGKV
jgi:SOS-response transcriptional repressor LexA